MEDQAISFIEQATQQLAERSKVEPLAKEAAAKFGSVADLILDLLDDEMRTAAKQTGDEATQNRLVNMWFFVDKLCKFGGPSFLGAVKGKLGGSGQPLAQRAAPVKTHPRFPQFVEVLSSLKMQLPDQAWIFSLIERDLGLNQPRGGGGGAGGLKARSNMALTVQSQQVKTIGAGFIKQTGVAHQRESNALQVRTVDSLMALRTGGTYAPAAPAEINVAQVVPDADAPEGYVQALPAGYEEDYMNKRRKRFRDIFAAAREDIDAEAAEAKKKRAGGGLVHNSNSDESVTAEMRAAQELLKDVIMPLDLPRDEYGIKKFNYPEGVRFVREAIRACGGAIELEVIVQRIGTLADKETVREFGEIREFINEHSPTFRVDMERGKWIVRLQGEESARLKAEQESLGTYSWEEMQCPGCTRILKGRNFERHFNSRQCIGRQLANGEKGFAKTPISRLAQCANIIQAKLNVILQADSQQQQQGQAAQAAVDDFDLDDDDLIWFADCIEAAGNERRFKLAATHHFLNVLRAIRAVRDYFVKIHGVTEVDEVQLTIDDAAFVKFFETLGRNVRRLPIPWIETGDVIDMCHRFSHDPKQPYPPPPRGGDPRMKMNNQYPGMLFADSDDDRDDVVSGDEDAFSDDEGEGWDFAPPVSVAETMMIAARERDTRKLNYRLRTAPPMKVSKVLKHEANSTVQRTYADIHQNGAEGQSSLLPADLNQLISGGGSAGAANSTSNNTATGKPQAPQGLSVNF